MERFHQFGVTIKELRTNASLTQRELAEKVGIDFTYLSKIEKGMIPPPSEKVIQRLAKVLSVDRNELLALAGRLPLEVSQVKRDKALSEFGVKLRELRTKCGFSLREVSDKVNVNVSYLSKIENGVKPPPSEKVIIRLAKALHTNQDELIITAGKIPAGLIKNNSQDLYHLPNFTHSPKQPISLRRFLTLPGMAVVKSFYETTKKGLVAMGNTMSSKQNILAPAAKMARSHISIITSIILTLTIISMLWLAGPAQALTIAISPTSGSGTLGSAYNFTITINVEDTVDRLPIQRVDLQIYQGSNQVNYTNLPIPTSASSTSSGTYTSSGGTINVSGTSGANWVYATSNRFGYGYGYQSGTWATQPFGYGYGYGYGYGSNYVGPTTLTYTVAWTSPSSWPTGTYNIKVIAYGDSGDASNAFQNDTASTVTLSTAAAAGGGGAPPTITPAGTTNLSNIVDNQGKFTSSVSTKSEDGKLTLDIKKDTVGKTSTGAPLTEITVTPMSVPPMLQAQTNFVGITYNLGPNGATFDPAITVTFEYDPTIIPAGVNPADLVLAYFDGSNWVPLEGCVVDPVNHTITAPVTHFTAFSIIAYSAPATFTTSGLTVSPAKVLAGESVTVTITVTNTGNLGGDYEAILKLNGAVAESKKITLKGVASEKVTFSVTKNTGGTYIIGLGGLSCTFVVEGPPAPAPTPAPAPAPAPAPTPTPTPTPTPLATPWLMIGGIIAGLIVFGIIFWLIMRNREIT